MFQTLVSVFEQSIPELLNGDPDVVFEAVFNRLMENLSEMELMDLDSFLLVIQDVEE